MINNICENNKAAKTNKGFKATTSMTVKVVSKRNEDDKANDVSTAANGNINCGGGVVQTTYGHGIWYSEIIAGANNNANNNEIVGKQQYISDVNGNNNNKETAVNRNVWLPTDNCDVKREQQQHQQQQQQSHSTTHTNNECDIIIVDIEDDVNDNNEVPLQQQHEYHRQQKATYGTPPKFFINENMKFSQKHPIMCDSERGIIKNNIPNDGSVNIVGNVNGNDGDKAEENEEDDEDDSLASMETLSDNVSIWIDGEKHWVAGVDANTTCSELIWALLNYQNEQETNELQLQQQEQYQHAFAMATTVSTTLTNEQNIATTNSNQYKEQELKEHQQQQQQQQQQQIAKACDKKFAEFNLRMSTNEHRSNKPNIQNTANTNNTYTTNTTRYFMPINQSMPMNAKENCKIIHDSILPTSTVTAITALTTTTTESAVVGRISAEPPPSSSTLPIKLSSAPVSVVTPPTLLPPLTLPPGIATISQLATEYVIVKQYHHCEEYLDGSTKVFDVLPSRNGANKKECELLLRHLGPAPAVYINNTPQLSSLISTDKDSGMGSPVGSARSAKFRRRKHKSSQWLAQANTLHPKLSRCSANERLMKIILAQDETIQRQLSLLREKERQITKIEEEKHRKRERELGKNYLLETYLNGLDEAECEPEIQEDGGEIFVDELYRCAATTKATTTTTTPTTVTNPRIAIMPSALTLAAGAVVTDKIPSATEAKLKLKDKDVKKEKKKKRHKEKHTKNEEIQAKDYNLKTNKATDRRKVEMPHEYHHGFRAIDENNIKDTGNEQEIELQLVWLEKIYALNKQLQKEEELATKLHAKVRKHQLRKAQQTQREVQMEIDKLDNNLALQCGDIRKVEANLMQTNEQLQNKLHILEQLSMEYLQEQQESGDHNKKEEGVKVKAEVYIAKDKENHLKNEANVLLSNLEKSSDTQKLFLNNINSKEEVDKLEKIIAKPNTDLCPANNGLKESNQLVKNMAENTTNTKKSSVQPTTVSTNLNHQQHQQPESIAPAVIATLVAGHTSHNEEATLNDTVSTPSVFIDKNMLSSLHVQNVKTIKKQMFHTHATASPSASAVEAATSSASMPSSSPSSVQILSPPKQLSLITSGFPKRQFQHITQPHMPMASTLLTSRPQDSHQIQATNIVIVQQPSATAASSLRSSHLTSTTSSPLASEILQIQTAAQAQLQGSATASAYVLKSQQPPTSISPSPSIMAMNTVDISQLGTLV